MAENTKVAQAVEELKGADEEQLRKIIERWFDKTRTEGLKLGAQMISVVIDDAIAKNLKNGFNSSLRDYQRAIKRIVEITSVQLKQRETIQNDSMVDESNEAANEVTEEVTND